MSSTTITVDREVIAALVDWINTGLDLDYWRDYGDDYAADQPETFELFQQVAQILDSRSWEGQA